MTYYVIGLMSGSSLDGLDIIHTSITYVSGKWEYEINQAACLPFSDEWQEWLKHAQSLSVGDYLRLDTAFGKFIAEEVVKFREKHDLLHRIHFIVSHGHTVFHDPNNHTSVQIGDGSTIAALTGYPTISNLRSMDVALGGQGAPIVPIADQLLFQDYHYCLNLGGIANVTINGGQPLAFDICPANQVLNDLSKKAGSAYDDEGRLAESGTVNPTILKQLDAIPYYSQTHPKSLDNEFAKEHVLPLLSEEKVEDALATAVKHIAGQIAKAIQPFHQSSAEKMLVTGGGAFNRHLVDCLSQELAASGLDIEPVVPDEKIIKYKEALAMALFGVLRWREEANVLQSVTGATRNSVGGALWLGA